MKKRIAEIIHYTLDHIDELWDNFKTNKCIADSMTEQIMSEPITHTENCQECGGSGLISVYDKNPTDIIDNRCPSCKDGKVDWVFEWTCPQSSEMGCLQPPNAKELCAIYNANKNCAKLLTVYDLTNPDVALLYHSCRHALKHGMPAEFGGDVGTLRAIRKERG